MQLNFIRTDLSHAYNDPEIDFTIVIMHLPMYSSRDGGSFMDMRNELQPIFDLYGVDLVLNGHRHAYERTYPVMFNNTVTDNEDCSYDDPDGQIYVTIGTGGASHSPFKLKHPWSVVQNHNDYGFLNIKLLNDGKTLYGEFVSNTGKVMDAFQINLNDNSNKNLEDENWMLIISQNLTNYNIPIPKDAIFRVNLAWCDSIAQLNDILKKHSNTQIFLDLPIKRIKPPNNKYAIEDLVSVINSNEHIRYLAISNVESDIDLKKYIELFPESLIIIPKIESSKAIENLQNIASILNSPEKIFMLDHDDLFSDILKKNEPESKFKEHMKTLIEFCDKNNIKLLRTVGVIFNDEEKRLSQYVN